MAKFSEVVQGRIDADQEFQTSIASLTDAEKATKIAEKRAVLIEEEGDKALTISEDQKIRAKKAEDERDLLKNDPRLKPAEQKKEGDLTAADVLTFTNAQVTHPDDVATVQQAAKVLGIDNKTALTDPIVLAKLASDKEKRAAAGAADRGGGRGGAGSQSDAELLTDFRNGKIPPAGSPDSERLWKLRRQSNTGSGRQG